MYRGLPKRASSTCLDSFWMKAYAPVSSCINSGFVGEEMSRALQNIKSLVICVNKLACLIKLSCHLKIFIDCS